MRHTWAPPVPDSFIPNVPTQLKEQTKEPSP